MIKLSKVMYMLLGGLLALALVIGGTAVLAQTDEGTDAAPPTQDETPTDNTTPPAHPGRGFNGQHGFRGPGRPFAGHPGDQSQYLADALGITVEELEAAQETARQAALDQAVADGVITQEQVDLMAAGRALQEYIDRDAILAEVLGLSVEEVTAAKEDGTLRDLLAESELTPEEIMSNMQAAVETAVEAAIADGVITQEQADQLQNDRSFGSGGFGGPRGGHGGRGMHGGFGGQMPFNGQPLAPDTLPSSNA